jgi:hypothetical protein
MRRAAAPLLFLAGWSSTARAADLEVGPGKAYATIQAAVDAAAPGDVVLVDGGSYGESLALSESGTAAAPIALRAAADATVVVAGAIEIFGDYWEVSDLTIEVPGDVRGIEVRGSHNRLQRLDLSGGANNGVDGSGEDNHVLECRIHDFDAGRSDAHCIVLNTNAAGWVIADNELFDCSGDAIQLYGPSDQALRTIKDTRIERNVMRWTGGIARMENAVDVKDADGLLIADNEMSGFVENKTLVFQKGPANIDVRCNSLRDGFTGVEFRGEGGILDGITFAQNLMVGFTEYGLKFDGVSSAEVFANTFVDVGSDGLRIEGAGLDAGRVQNNLWLRTGALDAGTFDADHNGYFETGSVGFASATDVEADPLLGADFALGAGSPMIDAGADVGLPFAGRAPDIGAFEDGVRACARGAGGGEGGGSPAGAGGGGPSGGTSTGGPSGAGGSTGADPGGDDGGCSCALPGRPHSSLPAVALLALLGGGVAGRLASRRVSARCARRR